jgi:hypothetical protein
MQQTKYSLTYMDPKAQKCTRRQGQFERSVLQYLNIALGPYHPAFRYKEAKEEKIYCAFIPHFS